MDGLLAATVLLPQLAAAALIQATTLQPGWREARKVAGQEFALVTSPLQSPGGGKALSQAAWMNQTNVVRVLGDMMEILHQMRLSLSEENQEELEETLAGAVAAREKWLQQRSEARWAAEEIPQTDTPSSGQVLGRLFGIRKRPDRKQERK